MCVCMSVHMTAADHGGQKKELDTLTLELQAGVSSMWVLRTELISARAVSALDFLTIESSLQHHSSCLEC